ncbi:lysylphosphatidylglycerol synthase transmembrane domain-containing protein [Mesorhizobium sp. B1-1-8]|uniref:lysylphosphatidylglycerol synthase transmembrane domain-containing protein n=1 Tax=Mesorhizobium sp. B1-1-8 TaxID=2589976 RepID=UPI001128F3BC|nr:YbhN family protein [Mesorhizobium sp. B1-1-8]UCI06013.1 lysylphosphatidylglycerol synthase domain-containing protein [Mesorhizobium sp. B1-1-8]
MKWRRFFWPVIGIAAVVFSLLLLWHELRGISVDDVWEGVVAIPPHRWILAALSSVVAYASLAGYDHIALLHIGRRVSWLFVTLCSFTTYALSHNIGGSVFSGAVIRYRAYGTRGLSGQEVGVLVAICWFTFILSCVFLGGLVLVFEPQIIGRFSGAPHHGLAIAAGLALLILVAAYVFGSWLHLKPLKIAGFQLHYPALPIVARQLLIGPVELLGAAAIIFFALPAAGNPGYFVVLGVFMVSFSVGLLSHAPGALGVFEVVFLTGLSDMDPVGVLAALLVFRLFYLIIPLLLGLCVVLFFEHSQYSRGEG